MKKFLLLTQPSRLHFRATCSVLAWPLSWLIYLCTAQNFRFRWRRGGGRGREEVGWGPRAVASSFVLHKLGNKKSVYAFATCYLCGRATNLASSSQLSCKCCTVNEAGRKVAGKADGKAEQRKRLTAMSVAKAY